MDKKVGLQIFVSQRGFMKDLLIELKNRDELLFYFGAANLLLAIAFVVLTRISNTQVLGVNAWIKPFKFSLSIGIYAWTMGWFVWYLPNFNKVFFDWSIIVLLGFEIIFMAIQAGRGQLSHFNLTSPFYKVLYGLMAAAATVTSLYTAYVGVLFFAHQFPDLPLYYVWAIRLGILLFVIFSFEGFLMGARLSHTVGAKDGSIGLPVVNWSLKYGDLRIAHFVGMHAMQVLPLLSFYLFKNTFLTVLAGVFYAMLATLVLITALQGKPLVKPTHMKRKQLPPKERQRLLHQYGKWAVVTGASSGIGLELAMQLAKAGFNLIINSRHAEDLHRVKVELESEFSIEVIPVAADVGSLDGVTLVVKHSDDRSVGLFVAAAGFGTSGSFIDNSMQKEVEMLQVNCEGLLRLTHYFGRKFAAQRTGGIILLSSIVAFQGVPFSANYAATKAFVQSLAEGLAKELSPFHVDVLAAAPGPVASNFGARANMKMNKMLSPAEIGVPILKTLGKRSMVLPGLMTKVLVYSLRMLPRWGKVSVMGKIMRGFTEHQIRGRLTDVKTRV